MDSKENKIIKEVIKYYRLAPTDLMGISRNKYITIPRQVAMFIIKEELGLSYPMVGKIFNRDHTTVMYAHNKIRKLLLVDPEIKKDIETIKNGVDIGASLKSRFISFKNLISSKKSANQKSVKWNPVFSQCRMCNTTDFEYASEGYCQRCFPKRNLESSKKIKKKLFKIHNFDHIATTSKIRLVSILKIWDEGQTLGSIGVKFELSRERVRQLVQRAIELEYSNNNSNSRGEDFLKYYNKRRKERSMKVHLMHNPERPPKVKIERWSTEHDFCLACGTTKNKHRSKGYCTKCYYKSDYFKKAQSKSWQNNKHKYKDKIKEYHKRYNQRPEVIKRMKEYNEKLSHGGNREAALEHDDYKCTQCAMTREESYKKSNKDLYVEHVNGDFNNNSLDNLATFCFRCHSKKIAIANKKNSEKIKTMNSLKVLDVIRQYNIKCQKSIDFKTITLLLGGDLGEDAIDRYVKYLLDNNHINQKYGNYTASDQILV